MAGALPPRLPDLVLESRIDTSFDPSTQQTKHVRTRVGTSARQRRLRSEETWVRRQALGRGSNGTVWLEARIAGEGSIANGDGAQLRAVKEIRKAAGMSVLELYRELEAIAKFSHDRFAHCFVHSFGWFESDDSLFIAMEYLKHGDLQRYLVRPFPEPEARQIALQVAEALQFMHENGFAHRDLKPGNILVFRKAPSWWVKIADFGISKRMEGATVLRTMQIGTRGYMAPELNGLYSPEDFEADLQDDAAYTAAIDIWALGEISHRMLTTKPTFGEPRVLYSYVTRGSPIPAVELQNVAASVPSIDFIRKAMAASAMKRLTAAEAVRHEWLANHEFIGDDSSDSDDESIPENIPTEPSRMVVDASGRWSTLSKADNTTEGREEQVNWPLERFPTKSTTRADKLPSTESPSGADYSNQYEPPIQTATMGLSQLSLQSQETIRGSGSSNGFEQYIKAPRQTQEIVRGSSSSNSFGQNTLTSGRTQETVTGGGSSNGFKQNTMTPTPLSYTRPHSVTELPNGTEPKPIERFGYHEPNEAKQPYLGTVYPSSLRQPEDSSTPSSFPEHTSRPSMAIIQDPLPYETQPHERRHIKISISERPALLAPGRAKYLCMLMLNHGIHVINVDEFKQRSGSIADPPYLYVDYHAEDFSHSSDNDLQLLHELAEKRAREIGLPAFWIACSCMRVEDALELDTWGMADIIRAAEKTVLIVRTDCSEDDTSEVRLGALDRRLQKWGSRLWSIPVFLASMITREIYIYHVPKGYNSHVSETAISSRRLANLIWGDNSTVRRLLDHAERTTTLTQVEQLVLIMDLLSMTQTSMYLPGDYIYVLMCFCPFMPLPVRTDSAFDAFVRLFLANKELRFLERWLCNSEEGPIHLLRVHDQWGTSLKDLNPLCIVTGLGSDETLLLNGAKGETISPVLESSDGRIVSTIWRFGVRALGLRFYVVRGVKSAAQLDGVVPKAKDLRIASLDSSLLTKGGRELPYWTLIDTHRKTIRYFRANVQPRYLIICGGEIGMLRAMLCSYTDIEETKSGGSGTKSVASGTSKGSRIYYREAIIRMEETAMEGLQSLGEVSLSPTSKQVSFGAGMEAVVRR